MSSISASLLKTLTILYKISFRRITSVLIKVHKIMKELLTPFKMIKLFNKSKTNLYVENKYQSQILICVTTIIIEMVKNKIKVMNKI